MPASFADVTRAFDWANTNGDMGEFRAYVCRQTGKVQARPLRGERFTYILVHPSLGSANARIHASDRYGFRDGRPGGLLVSRGYFSLKSMGKPGGVAGAPAGGFGASPGAAAGEAAGGAEAETSGPAVAADAAPGNLLSSDSIGAPSGAKLTRAISFG